MKKIIAVLFAVLLFSGVASAQDNSEVEKATYIKPGMSIPAFKVKMLNGTLINSADLKGKVVMINFWATWCPPCRREFARLQKDVIDRFAGKDFVLLPISVDDNASTVKEFMQKSGYSFPVGIDADKAIYKMFAEKYVPRNFIIGKDGKVAFYSTGYTPAEFDELLAKIAGMLDK